MRIRVPNTGRNMIFGLCSEKSGAFKIRQQKQQRKKLSQLVLFLSEHFDWRKAQEAGEQVQATPGNEMLI
jgi:hypothetical protein